MPWTVEDNKARIYYEVEGRGPAIVFVHPPGMGHLTFRRQKEELKKRFTVVAVDLRGNGRSGMDDQPFSMGTLAEDVVRVLDNCGIQETYACGYSNGGSVVQELAIKFPERIKGVVLLGSFSEVNSILLRNEFKLGIWATRNKMMNLVSNVLAGAHEWNPFKMYQLSSYIKQTSPEILEKYYRMGLNYVSTDRLRQITCPVLLIYGERDDYVHHYRHLFKKYVQGPVTMILVGSVAHQTPTKKGSALNQIIKNFIHEYENPSYT
ncbi:alpha/beta fold hydrolase [Evansella tamaricis]|uniref:Alpha/beta hydrolase n=1 Tax=Evansella tamaricis TaxID=2069301 RepID=A0ABS6JMI8_9BACI|nr:alpha/beta hydrolase [Evansella tamaricis]MBU9714895.1 alpha/beta hydrolase [Evansella tamaricis]